MDGQRVNIQLQDCILHLHYSASSGKNYFKNCKNISTGGEVMLKIRVASFFLGHSVDIFMDENHLMQIYTVSNKVYKNLVL